MMREAVRAAVAGLAISTILASPPASAASFGCNAARLSRVEVLICTEPQLSRAEELIAQRIDAVARRLNYGQYLGLRHWQATSAQQRNQCTDRPCISAHLRAQSRLLDRFQQCVESRLARRGCLREALSLEHEISGAAGRRGAAGAP